MGAEEEFVTELARAIVFAGGTAVFDEPGATALAGKVLAKLRELGPFAYPSLLDQDGLRFVYQWDEIPPLMTVMLWDEQMWRDMARIPVPKEIDEEINS
ncbi:MAG TPA: hypothetical protein VD902_13300 [Symbiobacteriaceae bacterium]|nr:hypothetical protein [Symbiobacteriaceae bacterium]